MMLQTASLLVVALLARSALCHYEPVCNASNYTRNLSVPLPDHFSMSVEVNILQRNRSITVHEYYHGDGNRGRIRLASDDTETVYIYDYDDAQVFLIPDRTGDSEVECGVRVINRNTPRPFLFFGYEEVDGKAHIASVQRLFGLSEHSSDVGAVYVGVEQVRGIPCDRWQTCHVHGKTNLSFTLDYYLSVGDVWNSTYLNDPYPVQLVLIGSRYVSPGETYDFHHVYSITSFNSGPDAVPDELFSVPTGLVCRDRKPGPPPPEIGSYFSTYLEYVRNDSTYLIRVS